jgi:hypothetical protein
MNGVVVGYIEKKTLDTIVGPTILCFIGRIFFAVSSALAHFFSFHTTLNRLIIIHVIIFTVSFFFFFPAQIFFFFKKNFKFGAVRSIDSIVLKRRGKIGHTCVRGAV